MKDRGEGWLVGPLGDLLAEVLDAHQVVLDRVDLIVPVPANPSRQRGRGYDITAGLAARVEARFGIPMVQVLQQTKDAPELRGLGQWDRQRALADLYQVIKPEWVSGWRVLIVDDVITYGTTLREIARMLRADGAREIYAAALGHTERSA
jgi:predicted amidophosphoribosyltransferase